MSLGTIFFIYIADVLDDTGRKYSLRGGILVLRLYVLFTTNLFTMLVGLGFKPVAAGVGIVGAFVIFLVTSLLCFIYCYFYMVESKGKNLA